MRDSARRFAGRVFSRHGGSSERSLPLTSPSPTVTAEAGIIYALVNRGSELVLANYTAPGLEGNFAERTIKFLPKLDRTVEWKSYSDGAYAYHYIIDGELVFVCMASKSMKRRIPFAFLNQVQERFRGQYNESQISSAVSGGMQTEFEQVLQELVINHNSPEGDRIASLMIKIQDINDIILDSIKKLEEREESIEKLVVQSKGLAESSVSYYRGATMLRNREWWREKKMAIILSCLVLLVIIMLLFASCGITFEDC